MLDRGLNPGENLLYTSCIENAASQSYIEKTYTPPPTTKKVKKKEEKKSLIRKKEFWSAGIPSEVEQVYFWVVNGFQNRFGVAEVIIVYGFVRELVRDFFGCTG